MSWGWGPLKGAVSAQKAFQGSETETRELLGGTGTEENSVSPTRGHWFALQANQWFFLQKRKQKKDWVSDQAWWWWSEWEAFFLCGFIDRSNSTFWLLNNHNILPPQLLTNSIAGSSNFTQLYIFSYEKNVLLHTRRCFFTDLIVIQVYDWILH